MADASIEVTLYDKGLFEQFKRAREAALDLRPPFRLIQESWWKGNRAIFDLKGPGKYADLKKSTKVMKTRYLGTPYPIFRFSGDLEASMTQPGDPENFVGKTFMTVGTSRPYAGYLHSGTKYMKARPLVLLGPEQVAPDALKTRQENWIKLVSEFINDSLEKKP